MARATNLQLALLETRSKPQWCVIAAFDDPALQENPSNLDGVPQVTSFPEYIVKSLGYAEPKWIMSGLPIRSYNVGGVKRHIYAVGGSGTRRAWSILKSADLDPLEMFRVCDHHLMDLMDDPNFPLLPTIKYSWLSNAKGHTDGGSIDDFLNPYSDLSATTHVYYHTFSSGAAPTTVKLPYPRLQKLRFCNYPPAVEGESIPSPTWMSWVFQLQFYDFVDAVLRTTLPADTSLPAAVKRLPDTVFRGSWRKYIQKEWLKLKNFDVSKSP